MEGYPRGPEISKTTLELLQSPEQVFDSDVEEASQEAERVAELIRRNDGICRQGHNVEICIESESRGPGSLSKPAIQITWAGNYDDHGLALYLSPVDEGKGVEGGVLAYRGSYGVAKRNRNGKFIPSGDPSQIVSLEQLFQVPEGVDLYVRPTVSRWAVERKELTVLFGETARSLYMGLGFLLSGKNGHKWMHIGMHEAGHLPSEHDENKAWRTANSKYASLYHGKRNVQRQIVQGETKGQFDLLEKPFYGSDLTIGKIMRYGLTSHAMAGNAVLPKQWKRDEKKTMDEFGRRIVEAQEAFDHFIK